MKLRTTLNYKAAETAEHLARLVKCPQTQKRLINAAQRARSRATGEKR